MEFINKIIEFLSKLFGKDIRALDASIVVPEAQKTGYKFGVKYWFKYDDLFKYYANLHPNVDWRWLKGIALCESSLGLETQLLGYDGKSWGMMHFTIPTATQYLGYTATPEILMDTNTSVMLAARYVSYLEKFFKGDLKKIIMSYNQGEGNTQRGRTYAQPYWERFQRWYVKINDCIEGRVK